MQLRDRLCCEPMPVFPTHKIPISLVFLEVPNVQKIMSVYIWIVSNYVSDFLSPLRRCFECNILRQLGNNRLGFPETPTDSLSTHLMSNGKYLNFNLAQRNLERSG